MTYSIGIPISNVRLHTAGTKDVLSFIIALPPLAEGDDPQIGTIVFNRRGAAKEWMEKYYPSIAYTVYE